MIKTIFKCETITPMFLAGADGRTPELRPPSIKGMLRFWWRTIQACPVKQLREKEGKIFGSSEEEIGRSTFRLIIKGDFETKSEKPLPHHFNDNKSFQLPAIKAGTSFQILTDAGESLHNLFILTSILGGLGKRSRRGFGSFAITHIDEKLLPRVSMESVLTRMNVITDKYKIEGAKIVAKDFPDLDYPYIKLIKFGDSENSYQALLKKIGETSHTHDSVYTGTTKGTRLASPVYVSIIRNSNGGFIPIITLLNTVFRPGYDTDEKNLQNSFIGALL
ncbi:hypothetical protein BMS3Bbin03_00204 [bacterium BMS3Bbin03]|nr:hypothetical protein BMS3Bbin03_00204 [bacterium BMS3Bbin03]